MMDELSLLEEIELKDACALTLDQFAANGNNRTMNLSKLEGPRGFCVWCGDKLHGRKVRWCNGHCASSAMWHANPQTPEARVYRLIYLQGWGCKMCGISFEDFLRKKIRDDYRELNRSGRYGYYDGKFRERTESDANKKTTLWSLGRGTGHIFQTDHIIPIHKGGAGIDPNNLQTICVPCHWAKTKIDRKK